MRARKVSVTGLAAAAVVLAVTASASAQIDPGVNYDPGSPAGKEYAIPLVEGRSDGAGTTNWQEGANIPFGVGIQPVGRGNGRRGSSRGGRGGPGSAAQTGRDAGRPSGANARRTEEELTARIRAAETPGGTAARTFVLALAVLLPAALLGLLLRQRPQPSRTGSAA